MAKRFDREEMAVALAAHGFTLDECRRALIESGDDVEAAAISLLQAREDTAAAGAAGEPDAAVRRSTAVSSDERINKKAQRATEAPDAALDGVDDGASTPSGSRSKRKTRRPRVGGDEADIEQTGGFDAGVASLVGMGFAKRDAARTLRTCKGNVHLASQKLRDAQARRKSRAAARTGAAPQLPTSGQIATTPTGRVAMAKVAATPKFSPTASTGRASSARRRSRRPDAPEAIDWTGAGAASSGVGAGAGSHSKGQQGEALAPLRAPSHVSPAPTGALGMVSSTPISVSSAQSKSRSKSAARGVAVKRALHNPSTVEAITVAAFTDLIDEVVTTYEADEFDDRRKLYGYDDTTATGAGTPQGTKHGKTSEKAKKTKPAKKHPAVRPAGAKGKKAVEIEDRAIADEHCGAHVPIERIKRVSGAVTALEKQGELGDVKFESMIQLMRVLHDHVRSAAGVSIEVRAAIEMGESLSKTDPNLQTTIAGTEAAIAAAQVVASHDTDRRLLSEELVRDCASLLQHHLQQHVFPGIDPTFVSEETPGKGAGKSSKIIRAVVPLAGALSVLMDCLAELVSAVALPDALLLEMCQVAMSTLPIDGGDVGERVQLAAIGVVRAVFCKFVQHRQVIIDDLLGTISRSKSSGRRFRAYQLRSGASIQMVSALILHCVHGSARAPPEADIVAHHTGDNEGDIVDNTTPDARRGSSSRVATQSYTNAAVAAQMFVTSFCDRVIRRDHIGDFRQLFMNFVDDLLAVVDQAEWPGAEPLLDITVQTMCTWLPTEENPDVPADRVTIVQMAAGIVGSVVSKVMGCKAEIDANPITLRKPPQAPVVDGTDPTADEEDASCLCNQGYDGRMMLDCDSCHRWYHGVCIGITHEHAPEFWVCDDCVLLSQVKSVQRQLDTITSKAAAAGEAAQSDAEDRDAVAAPAKRRRTNSTGAGKSNSRGAGRKRSRRGRSAAKEESTNGDGTTEEKLVPSDDETAGAPDDDLADSKGNQQETDMLLALQQVTINYLSKQARVDDSVGLARRCWLSKWATVALKKGDTTRCRYFVEQWKLPDAVVHEEREPVFTPWNTTRVARRMLTQSKLGRSCPSFLRSLLNAVRTAPPKVRYSCIKAISSVVESDPSLMEKKLVMMTVQLTVKDDSVSVREAAVDLVGRYIAVRPALLTAYQHTLLDSLYDKGVSVRKRVVRIFNMLLLRGALAVRGSGPDEHSNLRMKVLQSLLYCLSLAGEEETVKQLITETFDALWFSAPEDALRLSRGKIGVYEYVDPDAEAPDEREMPPPNLEGASEPVAVEGGTENPAMETAVDTSEDDDAPDDDIDHVDGVVNSRVRQIILLLCRSMRAGHRTDWLEPMLRRVLRPDGDSGTPRGDGDSDAGSAGRGDDHEMLEAAVGAGSGTAAASPLRREQETCRRLVGSVVEFILLWSEGNVERPSSAESEPDALKFGDAGTYEFVAAFAALRIFTVVQPAILVSHVETLAPFLKGEPLLNDRGNVAMLAELVPAFTAVVPLLHRYNRETLTTIEADLLGLVRKSLTPKLVMAAATCVGALVEYATNNSARLLGVLQGFFSFLQTHAAAGAADPATFANIERALYGMGVVCNGYDFDKGHRAVPSAGKLAPGTIVERVFELYLNFVNDGTGLSGLSDADAERRESMALLGLGYLWSRRPRLLLTPRAKDVVRAALLHKSHVVRIHMLRAFKNILEAEQSRTAKGLAAKANPGTHVLISGDQDPDAAVMTGIVQLNFANIRTLLFSPRPEVRVAALSLVGVIVRHGLVNPRDCVAPMIALQTDRAVQIREEALLIFVSLAEKHPAFVESEAVDGVILSYRFQVTAFGNSEVLARSMRQQAQSGAPLLSTMYQRCTSRSVSARNSFLSALINRFDPSRLRARGRAAAGGGGGHHGSKVGAEVDLDLGLLGYITRTLAAFPYTREEEPLFIIHCVNKLVALEGSQLSDVLRPYLSSKTAEGAETVEGDGVDVPPSPLTASKQQIVLHNARRAVAVSWLIQLKQYLKFVFDLKNERVQNFTLQSKGGERHASRLLGDTLALPALPPCLYDPRSREPGSDVSFDLDALKGVYATYKKLLKGDPADFAVGFQSKLKQTKARRKREAAATPTAIAKAEKRKALAAKKKKAAKRAKLHAEIAAAGPRRVTRGRKVSVGEVDGGDDDSDSDFEAV